MPRLEGPSVDELTIAIWGVGLIGGSLGMGWRAVAPRLRILGVDRPAVLDRAVARGAIDLPATPDQAIEVAQLHVLAAPVGVILQLADEIGARLPPGAVVTDVGSTKARIVERWNQRLAPGASFVGGHPMFGREIAGIDAADPGLVQGAYWFLTPGPRSAPAAVGLVQRVVGLLRPRLVLCDPAEHDDWVAQVSHLPQAVASALAASVAGAPALRYAGRGFTDTTRLAASPADIWTDIFRTNRSAVLAALDAFQGALQELRSAIESGDEAAVSTLFERAQSAVRRG
jgi:prephenate dehydrogenase